MKRSIAIALAIAIFAAVAVCFLRPIDENPNFGYADRVFSTGHRIPVTDCTGDTDLLRVEYILPDYAHFGCSKGYEIRFTSARDDLVFSYPHYVDGKQVSENGIPSDAGLVERFENSEWVDAGTFFYANMYYAGSAPFRSPMKMADGSYSAAILDSADGLFSTPGLYRFTHYFRECVSDDSFHFETGEQLYSVSHTLEIPEPTTKPFDVLQVMLHSQERREYEHDRKPYVRLHIRLNGGSLYFDTARAELEVKDGLRWVEVAPPDGKTSAVRLVSEDLPVYQRYIGADTDAWNSPAKRGEPVIISKTFDFNVDADPAADYRLTLHFSENEDGSGEQHTLTLRLRFDE